MLARRLTLLLMFLIALPVLMVLAGICFAGYYLFCSRKRLLSLLEGLLSSRVEQNRTQQIAVNAEQIAGVERNKLLSLQNKLLSMRMELLQAQLDSKQSVILSHVTVAIEEFFGLEKFYEAKDKLEHEYASFEEFISKNRSEVL